jgi:hypothetical protein
VVGISGATLSRLAVFQRLEIRALLGLLRRIALLEC